MKQRYLPESYLEGFRGPGAGDGGGSIWVYDFENVRWKNMTVEKAAEASDYYSVGKKEPGLLENIRELFPYDDREAARVISERVKARVQLTQGERASLAEFLAVLKARAPLFRSGVEHDLGKSFSHVLAMLKSGKQDPDMLAPDMFEAKRPDKILMGMTMRELEKTAYGIMKMKWTFLMCEPPACFVTSDFPHVESARQVNVPLTSSVCLFCSDGSDRDKYVTVPEESVEDMNLRTIMNARNFVFSPKRKFRGSSFFDARKKYMKERK